MALFSPFGMRYVTVLQYEIRHQTRDKPLILQWRYYSENECRFKEYYDWQNRIIKLGS
jgi:hypothetical protein